MASNIIMLCKIGNLLNWVDNPVRIVRIRSIEAYCIGVNQRFHVVDISLKLLIELGLANFNIEIHGSLINRSMNSVGDNS
jgi:hypothetical protein